VVAVSTDVAAQDLQDARERGPVIECVAARIAKPLRPDPGSAGPAGPQLIRQHVIGHAHETYPEQA